MSSEKKRGPGRPTKRTPEIESGIIMALEQGVPLRTAARANGIGPRTLDDWREADEDFRERCENAIGRSRQVLSLKLYEKANGGDMTALIWWQKCRDPDFREPKDQAITINMTGIEGVDDLGALAAEALKQAIADGASPAALKSIAEAIEKIASARDKTEARAMLEDIKRRLDEGESAA